MRKAVFADLLVGGLQSLDQRRLRVVAGKVAIGRNQRFHRQPARFLTAFVAAHAVCNNRQPSLAQELLVVLRLPITKRIFVILAYTTDIRLDRHLDSGTDLHLVTALIAGMTGIGNDCVDGRNWDYKGCGQDAQTTGRLQKETRTAGDIAVLVEEQSVKIKV